MRRQLRHRCGNGKTISERKIIACLTTYLRDHLGAPDAFQTFMTAFGRRFKEDEGSPTKELEARVDRQRGVVANVTAALVTVPGSASLGAKLLAAERALAELEAQLRTVTTARPRVLPQATIASKSLMTCS